MHVTKTYFSEVEGSTRTEGLIADLRSEACEQLVLGPAAISLSIASI